MLRVLRTEFRRGLLYNEAVSMEKLDRVLVTSDDVLDVAVVMEVGDTQEEEGTDS